MTHIPRSLKILISIGFIWGIPLIMFGEFNPKARYNLSIEGRILSSETKCNELIDGRINRCVHTYEVLTTKGETVELKSGNDSTLRKPYTFDVPVRKRGLLEDGDYIIKNRGEYHWTLNDKVIHDYHVGWYKTLSKVGYVLLAIGCIAGLASFFIWKSKQKK